MEPKYKPADMIGTHKQFPHMVVAIVNKVSQVDPDSEKQYYRLMDILTGNIALSPVHMIDRECLYHNELTAKQPNAFDGYYKLISGGLVYYKWEEDKIEMVLQASQQ